jgi:hypothetical protein
MKRCVLWFAGFLAMFSLTSRCQLPILGISQNQGNVFVLVTNAPLAGFMDLQSSPSLGSSAIWTDETDWQAINAQAFQFSASSPEQFYRLLYEIPVFEFAIFYNMNLEIADAQTFNVTGPVYSNEGLWSGSTAITFDATVSAVGLATNAVKDPFCVGYTGSGASTYAIAKQPTTGAPQLTVFNTNICANPAVAEAFLNIPPTNYAMGTSAAASRSGQYYMGNEADLYLTNFPSGTNWGWNSTLPLGAPMALYYQDPANAPNYLTWCTNDFYIYSNYYHGVATITTASYVPIPTNISYSANSFGANHDFWLTNGRVAEITWTNISSTNWLIGTNYVWYMGYSFLTNVLFYDWREGFNRGNGPPKTVRAVQMDLKALNRWMTNPVVNSGVNYNSLCINHKGHAIDSIYIFNAVPLTATILPAVRVINGATLPTASGFTLATAMPLYVWGDYNISNSFGISVGLNDTTYTEPAGLMADAITILSDNWSDANSAPADKSIDASGGPTAANTTINAACLAGIVPSNPNNPLSESSSDGYSGGVENFFRLLENWNPAGAGIYNLTYNGSMVAMFPSQYATNCWQQTGYYYVAPNRTFAYDTNLFTLEGLPPLTPTVANFVNP